MYLWVMVIWESSGFILVTFYVTVRNLSFMHFLMLSEIVKAIF